MKHVAAWLGWWFVLFWLWLLLSGDWRPIEWIAAACAATVAATVGEIARARARAGVAPRIPLRWVAQAGTAIPQIFVDFGIITWALLQSLLPGRGVRGVFRAHSFPAGEGPGVRAWAAWAANFSPNAYVVDIDEERDLVLVHDVVPHRPSEKPV